MKPHIVFKKGYWRVANPLGKRHMKVDIKIRNLWEMAYHYVLLLNHKNAERARGFTYANSADNADSR